MSNYEIVIIPHRGRWAWRIDHLESRTVEDCNGLQESITVAAAEAGRALDRIVTAAQGVRQ